MGGYSFRTNPYVLTPEATKYNRDDYEHLDSDLEAYFDWWAAEAIACGFMADVHLVDRIQLRVPITEHRQVAMKTKMKWTEKKITRGITYQPDRALFFRVDDPRQMSMVDTFFRSDEKDMLFYDSSPKGFFKAMRWGDYMVCVIDIKPPKITMREASGNTFPIKQALLWDEGLYVQKIVLIPSTRNKQYSMYLFPRTWTPDRYFKTDKNGKPRVIHYKPKRSVIQYEKEIGLKERLI